MNRKSGNQAEKENATVFLLHTYMKKAKNNHCHIVTKHVIVGWAMIVKRPVQNAKIWRDEGLQSQVRARLGWAAVLVSVSEPTSQQSVIEE